MYLKKKASNRHVTLFTM